jgi:hypothetical protein
VMSDKAKASRVWNGLEQLFRIARSSQYAYPT